MAFIVSEITRAGVRVKQAPAPLQGDLPAVTAPMTAYFQGTDDPAEKVVLARTIMVLAVIFSTTN